MRCHYMSDLHLEAQTFDGLLPNGEILILAGDLCNATFLDPKRKDLYSIRQRDRVLQFIDAATKNFQRVLFVAGNHEHYQGTFDETIPLLRASFHGVTVLDNETVDIDGVRFFGATLWSDFEGRSQACMDHIRRSVGEFLLVKKRCADVNGETALKKFQPEDALQEFDRSLAALRQSRDDGFTGQMVVITHHAPSFKGLNALHKGNGLDGAFASDLDEQIAELSNVPYWVHGHTHVQARYRVGDTTVVANCRGFGDQEAIAQNFSTKVFFEISIGARL